MERCYGNHFWKLIFKSKKNNKSVFDPINYYYFHLIYFYNYLFKKYFIYYYLYFIIYFLKNKI